MIFLSSFSSSVNSGISTVFPTGSASKSFSISVSALSISAALSLGLMRVGGLRGLSCFSIAARIDLKSTPLPFGAPVFFCPEICAS